MHIHKFLQQEIDLVVSDETQIGDTIVFIRKFPKTSIRVHNARLISEHPRSALPPLLVISNVVNNRSHV